MRRIVVIAAGRAGLRAATRIKRRLPEHEVNVIIPAAAGKAPPSSGKAGRQSPAIAPDLEIAASRGVGVLEAEDIMPDLSGKEIQIRSARGQLPVRYTDLVVEAPALVRIPRALRKAANVFSWPRSDFGTDGDALDAALAGAASSGRPVLVAGNGMEALEALFAVITAGAGALFAQTGEKGAPGLDPLLSAQVLLRLVRSGVSDGAGPTVACVRLPETAADRPDLRLSDDGTLATALRLPAERPGEPIRETPLSCVLLTAPLLASHPLLREEGVQLDSCGRITLGETFPADAGLVLMGSGAALPGAKQAGSGLRFPAWPGGEETAQASVWLAVDSVTGKAGSARASDSDGEGCGVFGIRQACLPGLRFFRAGFCQEEATARGLDVEYAVACLSGQESGGSVPSEGCRAGLPGIGTGTDGTERRGDEADDAAQGLSRTRAKTGAGAEAGPDTATPAGRLLRQEPLLVLSLLCERHSRTIVGVQALGCGSRAAEADALFGMATTALAGGISIDALSRREAFAGAARLVPMAAGIARNKLDTGIKGITPDEFLASREAGAEFFSLDLRSLPEWRSGHIPGAYSIPLAELKKRLQDEVPRYTPLVLISADGRDAYAAACRLAGLGATDLYVLDGGMLLWPHALKREQDKF